jgi:hypothetical protein
MTRIVTIHGNKSGLIKDSGMKKFMLILAVSLLCLQVSKASVWRNVTYTNTLENSTLRARFQAGNLYELTDLATTEILVNINPGDLPAVIWLFGAGSGSVNLDDAVVNQTVTANSIETAYTWADGTTWTITWSLDGSDLVLNTSAHSPTAVGGIYINITGCDIASHSATAIDNYGKCHTMRAPFTEPLLLANGGTVKFGMPWGFAQTMIVLFEGSSGGWVLEGRDPNVGPANIRPFGEGQTADMIISRAFAETLATQDPSLFEVRIRTYSNKWQDAVDPYIEWMRTDLGYVPIDQKLQTWVKNIYTQSYVACGDTAGLSALAARVDPSETYLGRQGYRPYSWDRGFPDYNVPQGTVDWISQATSYGFHVGLHTNIAGIDRENTAVIQQMEPGLWWTGTEWYGTSTHVYCSAAYEPWRDYLTNALAPVAASGATVIYLDQSTSPIGKFVVNGMTGTEGVMLLMKQLTETYPNMVLQTEGFNLMASRYACFALCEMSLGHSLSGYIFSHYIKIVPEGHMYSPTDLEYLDGFTSSNYILPGSDTGRTESWLEIVDAFQQYNLLGDSRLSLGSNQLAGFSGSNGVEAYFEETSTSRYLMVYEPYHMPAKHGVRYTNISEWSGPGYIEDWLIFNGSTMLGLDPGKTYTFDPSVTLDSNRFHITAIPADFQPYEGGSGIISQEVGFNDTNFRVFFSGNGQMEMSVSDEYDVYLNDQEVTVNRDTDTATITVSTAQQYPLILRVFQRSQQVMQGYWIDIFSSTPKHKSTLVTGLYSLFPPKGIWCHMSGEGFIIGKFPRATSIRIQGSWGMHDDAVYSVGDGVVRINGIEVMRLDPGVGPPYDMIPFDVDITAFCGKYAMFEFMFEGNVSGPDYSDWDAPQIVVSGIIESPQDCDEAILQGYTLEGDFSGNCYVDFTDVEYMVLEWLQCMAPDDPNCDHP